MLKSLGAISFCKWFRELSESLNLNDLVLDDITYFIHLKSYFVAKIAFLFSITTLAESEREDNFGVICWNLFLIPEKGSAEARKP